MGRGATFLPVDKEPSASHPAPRRTGRRSSDLAAKVAASANTTEHVVRSFFSRPWKLSPELRQAIATAVAAHGYRPQTPSRQPLAWKVVGVEVPRSWSPYEDNIVFPAQLFALVAEVQRLGGQVTPFAVDPVLPGTSDVTGGSTAQQQESIEVGHQAWLSTYAQALAPEIYVRARRARRISGFVVFDPRRNDRRIATLIDNGIPFVVLGLPADPGGIIYVETDNDWGVRELIRQAQVAGCRTFAHFGFTDDGSTVPQNRRRSLVAELGSGVPRYTKDYEKSGDDAVIANLAAWLTRIRPDAVVCDSDDYAALIARAAPLAGRVVARRHVQEHDLVLTGNDDAPVRRAASIPWLSLRPPNGEMAQAAARSLGQLVSGEPTEPVLIRPIVVGA